MRSLPIFFIENIPIDVHFIIVCNVHSECTSLRLISINFNLRHKTINTTNNNVDTFCRIIIFFSLKNIFHSTDTLYQTALGRVYKYNTTVNHFTLLVCTLQWYNIWYLIYTKNKWLRLLISPTPKIFFSLSHCLLLKKLLVVYTGVYVNQLTTIKIIKLLNAVAHQK